MAKTKNTNINLVGVVEFLEKHQEYGKEETVLGTILVAVGTGLTIIGNNIDK